MRSRLVSFLLALLFSLVAFAKCARADPWFAFGDARLEDRYADGDLDEEDLIARGAFASTRVGSGDVHAKTWVSLMAFYGERPGGVREWGEMAVVGIALDRVAQGSTHVVARAPPSAFTDDASTSAPAPAPAPASAPASASASPSPSSRPLAASLARSAVRAPWRASGIDADDARIDAMIARAHASAALPETRLRALRLVDDAQHSTASVDATGTYYDATGANLWLEARLTWRLDRLLYADDEPTIERVRLERQEARARVTARVLELLFAWERAASDAVAAPADSRAEQDATLRWWEAEIALDVLTGGWFSKQPGVSPP